MHRSSAVPRSIHWTLPIGLVLIFATRCFGQSAAENWLVSLSNLVDSYDQLVESSSAYRSSIVRSKDESHFGVPRLPDATQERSRSAIGAACLANLLLAEEYLPYDFELRETAWCKGQMTTDQSGRHHQQPIVSSDASGWSLPWLDRFCSATFESFVDRMHQNWESLAADVSTSIDKLHRVAFELDLQIAVHRVSSPPNLRELFGEGVMPNPVQIDSIDYARISIELWNELQYQAHANSTLLQNTWYQFRRRGLEPLYDLVTSAPVVVPRAQR